MFLSDLKLTSHYVSVLFVTVHHSQKWYICDNPTGGEERPWHLDQEEQCDSSDQSWVQHQETSHWWPGRGSHPRAASIGCLTGSLQSLTPPPRSSWTGRFLINKYYLSLFMDVNLSEQHSLGSLPLFLCCLPLLCSLQHWLGKVCL